MTLSLNRHWIDVDVVDRYAIATYSYDFENTDGTSNELQFEITIDVDSFISNFFADIDGELFYGQTKEKDTAKIEYNEAKSDDKNCILIHRPYNDIPNVFEVKTNINSNSKISLNITTEQYLKKQFNMNKINIQILKSFHKYKIIDNCDHVSCKFYIRDNNGIAHIDPVSTSKTIQIDEYMMNETHKKALVVGKIINKNINELTLTYKTKGEHNSSNILYDKKSSTFCHIITDIITDCVINENDICEGFSDKVKDNVLIPRRVIFVIDKSSSMRGTKWDKTIFATVETLKKLRIHDRYAIMFFNCGIEMHHQTMIKANAKNVNNSIIYLQNEKPNGGTDINEALQKGITVIKNDIQLLNNNNYNIYNFFMNQIIFITDGEANHGETDTKQIVLNVKQENILSGIDKYSNKISIYTFGVGSDSNDSSWINDLNHSMLKLLSINNNGIYKRIKQTYCDKQLKESFDILSKPVLTNINITYNNKHIKHITNTVFDTLFHGNDIVICGKFDDQKQDNLMISTTINAITGKQIIENNKIIIKPICINKQMNIEIDKYCNEYDFVSKIWAYLRLQQFAKQKLSEESNDYIYDSKLKSIISPLSLALKYSFVTPWTSMIVTSRNTTHNVVSNIIKTVQHKTVLSLPQIRNNKTKSSDAVNRPVSYSRDRKVSKKQRNEIFVDIIEKISMVINNNGNIISQCINGSIKIKSYLSNNVRLKLALNEDVMVDDIKFHDCVCLDIFDSLKEVSFIPPHGEFSMVTYRKKHSFKAPFDISTKIKMITAYKVEMTVEIIAKISEQNYGSNVCVQMVVPSECDKVAPRLHCGVVGQTTEYDLVENKVVWKIKKFAGNTKQILMVEMLFGKKVDYSIVQKEIGSIAMSFEIPMFNLSELQVKYLRIDSKVKYNPYRWVRYITKSDSYVCRL